MIWLVTLFLNKVLMRTSLYPLGTWYLRPQLSNLPEQRRIHKLCMHQREYTAPYASHAYSRDKYIGPSWNSLTKAYQKYRKFLTKDCRKQISIHLLL
jgi:hypothetical protein